MDKSLFFVIFPLRNMRIFFYVLPGSGVLFGRDPALIRSADCLIKDTNSHHLEEIEKQTFLWSLLLSSKLHTMTHNIRVITTLHTAHL